MTHVYILKENQLIKKICRLSDKDLNCIKKYLFIVKNSQFQSKPDLKNKDLKFNYNAGDIITFENADYLIYSIENKEFKCYRLKKRICMNDRIKLNNTFYSFDTKQYLINVKSKIKLKDTFNTSELERALDNIESRKVQKKTLLGVGSLIKCRELFYYIIGEDDKYYDVIRICLVDELNNMTTIKIKNGFYYTSFNRLIIKKTSPMVLMRNSNEEEMNYIRELSHIKRKGKRVKGYHIMPLQNICKERDDKVADFKERDILYNCTNKQYYLVLSTNNCNFNLVNINNLMDYYEQCLSDDNKIYKFYKTMDKDEFNNYKSKIESFMQIVNKF